LFLLCLAAGAWAFLDMPHRKNPAIRAGIAIVVTPWAGHTVDEVEASVAVPLEAALGSDPDVSVIRTTLRLGLAVFEAELDENGGPAPAFLARVRGLVAEAAPGLPPGAGPVFVALDAGEAASLLLAVAGPEGPGGARAIDTAARRLADGLGRAPGVVRVERSGAGGERLLLEIDPRRRIEMGLPEPAIRDLLVERGLAAPGGIVEYRAEPGPLPFRDADDLANAPIGLGPFGAPLLVRDLAALRVDPGPGPRQMLGRRDPASGTWVRTPAATLAVYRDPSVGAETFRQAVEAVLAAPTAGLPAGVTVRVVTDEAREVRGALELFSVSLLEAVLLVVAVALIGFRGWRSAAVLALAIPVTLALTFVLMRLVGVDLQQVSIGALILALGLLVDDPVVAADAAQRRVEQGEPAREAAWRGPVDLSRAILYATLTNVVAYLPLLVVQGLLGRFIWAIPVVVTASLVASRFVSMSFVPLFASHFGAGGRARTRPARPALRLDDAVHAIVTRRWAVLAGVTLLLVAAGAWALAGLRSQYFPRDPSRHYYVDVVAPDEARMRALAGEVETVVREDAVATLSFLGRAAPRFWFSMFRDLPRPGRAQVVVEAEDAGAVDRAVVPARQALPAPRDAFVDLRELEIGKPVGPPVQVRIAGPDPATLRALGARAAAALEASGRAAGVRDDWGILDGPDRPDAPVELTVGTIGDGPDARELTLRLVPPAKPSGVPGEIVSRGEAGPPRARRDGKPVVTVAAFAAPGLYPSEVLAAARPALDALEASLPAGYRMEYGGEAEEQAKGFRQLALALVLSVLLIGLALAIQFRSARKPLLVFATIPFGVAGAFVALRLANAPFGFMAFLGIASLIGVIVSHVIVLFDRIEALEREGRALEPALVDAVRSRARPVLVTVAATVIALVPLARRGGPLWQPLCYAQMGGLTL
ncbi:MAG: acriflavin resistance protein, partial [Acidobacteria bacterium]|nr:acriflavin resistance protein [Acidobacteriota bacterium]